MRISVETYSMRARFDDKTALEMIRAAGFDCFDYSMYRLDCSMYHWIESQTEDMFGPNYREQAQELRRFADQLGLVCNQAHAPFEMVYGDAFSLSDEKYARVVKSLEIASILGAKNVIVHAIQRYFPDSVDYYAYNRDFFGSLLPYCEKFDICVSVENLAKGNTETGASLSGLSDPAQHRAFVQSLGSDRFNICVDVGHSAITGSKPQDVIRAMGGELLKALHLQDNDGKTDLHRIPYSCSLEWDEILAALRDIRYSGDITLEITRHLAKLPDALMQSALVFAAQIARYFAAQLEA